MFRFAILSLIPASAGVLAYVVYRFVDAIKPNRDYLPVRHNVISIDTLDDMEYHLDVEHYDANGEYRRQQYRGGKLVPFLLYPQGVRVRDAGLRGFLETYVQQYAWSQEGKDDRETPST